MLWSRLPENLSDVGDLDDFVFRICLSASYSGASAATLFTCSSYSKNDPALHTDKRKTNRIPRRSLLYHLTARRSPSLATLSQCNYNNNSLIRYLYLGTFQVSALVLPSSCLLNSFREHFLPKPLHLTSTTTQESNLYLVQNNNKTHLKGCSLTIKPTACPEERSLPTARYWDNMSRFAVEVLMLYVVGSNPAIHFAIWYTTSLERCGLQEQYLVVWYKLTLLYNA